MEMTSLPEILGWIALFIASAASATLIIAAVMMRKPGEWQTELVRCACCGVPRPPCSINRCGYCWHCVEEAKRLANEVKV